MSEIVLVESVFMPTIYQYGHTKLVGPYIELWRHGEQSRCWRGDSWKRN